MLIILWIVRAVRLSRLAQLASVGLLDVSVANRQVSGSWQAVSQGVALGSGALRLFYVASYLQQASLGLFTGGHGSQEQQQRASPSSQALLQATAA